MSTPWIDQYTPAQRAAYGRRMRVMRAAEAEATRQREAQHAAWEAMPPGYCISFETGLPHDCGCEDCQEARAAGVQL